MLILNLKHNFLIVYTNTLLMWQTCILSFDNGKVPTFYLLKYWFFLLKFNIFWLYVYLVLVWGVQSRECERVQVSWCSSPSSHKLHSKYPCSNSACLFLFSWRSLHLYHQVCYVGVLIYLINIVYDSWEFGKCYIPEFCYVELSTNVFNFMWNLVQEFQLFKLKNFMV